MGLMVDFQFLPVLWELGKHELLFDVPDIPHLGGLLCNGCSIATIEHTEAKPVVGKSLRSSLGAILFNRAGQ